MKNTRIALVVAGTLAALAVGPTVTLRPDEVDLPIAPDQLLAHFQTQIASADDEVIANDGNRLVRRFSGRAGPFPYRTVEVVTYHSDSITFDHLAGPFKNCHERFQLDAITSGTRVTHTGSFRLRGGLWTAPLAFAPVPRAFEAHVRHHLETLAEEFIGSKDAR